MVLTMAVIATAALAIPRAADAQFSQVVLSEVVAANTRSVDSFSETSDWFELENLGDRIDLAGWSISDGDGNIWTLPATTMAPNERLLVWASGRDLDAPELHTNFSFKSSGEELRLANSAGQLVDRLTFPALGDDQAWGRGPDGTLGFLATPTPGDPNSALLPSMVTIETPGQTFVDEITIELSAVLAQGETIRYTLDGSDVAIDSDEYTAPFTIERSSVVRAAVTGNGVVGTDVSAGYTAVSSSIADFSSDLPIVLVHSTGVVGEDTQDAIVTIIEPGEDGRSGVFDPASYDGFAGLRIRGASSAGFDKKQYKFETWGDQLGNEVDVDLFGMGSDSDWVLYAPGRFDRAMINNAFMYELGHRIGVAAPEYQFVELFIEDNMTATVGSGDYRGLYLLREAIEIDDSRLDLTEHTDTSAGPEGGYIVRYDWADECCLNLEGHPQFGSQIAMDTPGATKATTEQRDWLDAHWDDIQKAAASDFASVEALVDVDDLLDGWLLEMLALDVDILRASHYMHLDAGGRLRAGPLWDYDRSLGGADPRVDELAEAESWKPNGSSGHSYESDIYADLWNLPEIQARLRSRWADLRQAELSDLALNDLIDGFGLVIAEAYERELTVWNDGIEYGPRFGNGLQGELDHMAAWVATRTAWLDDQFLNPSNPPTVVVPDTIQAAENEAVSVQLEASDEQAIVFDATGLPEGLTMNPSTGLISGTVVFGDGGTFPVSVKVTNSSGASTAVGFMIEVSSPLVAPPAVLLNEYNAVAPGAVLALGGADETLGVVGGNGGDWFEIVTLEDELDLRGWKFDIWSRTDTGTLRQSARLVLADDPLVSNLRAGSIVTIAESIPDDLSYDPANGDWTLQLQANTAQEGSMLANQTDFDTNNSKWRLVIRDADDAVRAEIVGETAPWDEVNLGVASDEVLAMRTDPRADADPVVDWVDSTQSSFGLPNTTDGVTQDFSSLRPDLTPTIVWGDVDCDGTASIIDALLVAQYSVGNRTAVASCPVANPVSEVVIDAADVNNDGRVDIVDSLLITRCEVGIENVLCQAAADE
jgi:hypothetical protein